MVDYLGTEEDANEWSPYSIIIYESGETSLLSWGAHRPRPIEEIYFKTIVLVREERKREEQ